MKKILAPVDFSEQSLAALQVALDLALKADGEVILYHVLYLPQVYQTGWEGEPLYHNPEVLKQMEHDAIQKLKKAREDAGTPVKVSVKVEFGDAVTCIQNQITECGIDLVVMGSSGVSGISTLLVGSVTEKIVRNASVPVLVVREPFLPLQIDNILMPSTLELNQTDFMKAVVKLQTFFNASLHILLINTPRYYMTDEEAQDALSAFVDHYKLTNYRTYFRSYYSEEEGITHFAYREGMNLIAMATHGRKGLSHLLNGSIAENIVSKIKCPIWTFCLKRAEHSKTDKRVNRKEKPIPEATVLTAGFD